MTENIFFSLTYILHWAFLCVKKRVRSLQIAAIIYPSNTCTIMKHKAEFKLVPRQLSAAYKN